MPSLPTETIADKRVTEYGGFHCGNLPAWFVLEVVGHLKLCLKRGFAVFCMAGKKMIERVSSIKYELLSEALSHLGEGVMITDNNLQRPGPLILYVNPAMCRISGYSSAEILDKSPRMFQGDLTDRSILSVLKSDLTQGLSSTVELVNYRKNGEPFDVGLHVSPIFNAKGECTNYVSVVRDLTESKRLAREIHIREHRLKAVLETAVDAIVTIDQHGIILSANRATVQMFGYTLDELLGANVNILMPEPFHREHDQYIRNYLETGHGKIIGVGRELSAQRKDGKLFPIDLSVAKIDNTGLFTGIIRDLTSRRELQQQVLEVAGAQQRKIGFHLQEGLGQDLTGLNLLAATLGEYVASIANRSSSQPDGMLMEEPELRQLQRLATRLVEGTVHTIKNLSELTLGVMPVQHDPHGLNAALTQLCTDLSRQTGLECRFLCETPLQVENHNVATHVYYIVKEGISNLVAHTKATHVHVRVFAEQDELVFEVFAHTKRHTSCPMVAPYNDKELASAIMRYRAGVIGASLSQFQLDSGETVLALRIHVASLAA